MTWQFIMFIRIFTGNIIYPVFLKKVADKADKTRQQFWLYFFSALLSLGLILWTKDFAFKPALLIIIALGILNSAAIYFNLRAVAVSLSKSSALTQFDDIISILLGYIFLNETRFLNFTIIIGILLCLGAAMLFINFKEIFSKDKEQSAKKLLFLGYVAGYSAIWGLVGFSMRYFSIEGIPLTEYVFCWYAGAWIGSILLLLFRKKDVVEEKINKKGFFVLFFASLFMWLSLQLSFAAFQLAPITIIQPIFLVSELIFPVLIGLFIFKEIKQISKIEIIALLLGIAGGVTIGFSF